MSIFTLNRSAHDFRTVLSESVMSRYFCGSDETFIIIISRQKEMTSCQNTVISFDEDCTSSIMSISPDTLFPATASAKRFIISYPESPRTSATRSSFTSAAPPAQSSSRLTASRIPPAAAFAIRDRASGSKRMPSQSAMYERRETIASFEMRLKSKRWHLEIMVAGSL